MAARSRKKGQRRRSAAARARKPTVPAASAPVASAPAAQKPAAGRAASDPPAESSSQPLSRSQRKDAEARAMLVPFAPGERPWPIVASVAVTTMLGVANFVLFVAGVKPHVSGQKPHLAEILVFTGLMLVCAGGMWRLRYWAVLGFETLLLIGLLGFSIALIKVESVFWAFAVCAIIAAIGYLFWKLVRVMGRIQMPTPPSRQR